MGKVVATINVVPEGVETDLEKIKIEIEKVVPPQAEIHQIKEEPIAFGLVSLKVFVTLEDAAGGTDPIEKAFSTIKGVRRVETVDVRRLL
ncbi:MAG: elongation factor 1-beta [Methanobacteriota archaeon]|nr:MAG: elongation factor 1-beta [Euryarchaeota archaeon]